jgi:hypothetical protein
MNKCQKDWLLLAKQKGSLVRGHNHTKLFGTEAELGCTAAFMEINTLQV